MYILAWLVLFGLLAGFFNEWLSNLQNPNRNPVTVDASNFKELILQPNRQHHYLSSGTINGEEVVFLLDTGATHVAVPSKLAQHLQLSKGRKHYVDTANGTAIAYQTRINSLTMGNIELHNLAASINPGMQGEVILLGMSALKQLEFTQKGELLILRQ
jgi:aspartyl protease family protein